MTMRGNEWFDIYIYLVDIVCNSRIGKTTERENAHTRHPCLLFLAGAENTKLENVGYISWYAPTLACSRSKTGKKNWYGITGGRGRGDP